MTTHTIVCSGADHDQRRGEPGWAERLGRLELPPDADPARALAGYLCGACAAARRAAKAKAPPLPPPREQLRALARAVEAVLSGGQLAAADRDVVRALAAR